MKKNARFMKKMLAVGLSSLCLSTAVFSTGCGPIGTNGGLGGGGGGGNGNITIDTSKAQLYVANLQGGIGGEWLEKVIARFEEAYKDVSFDNGKTVGVQIIPNLEYSVNGAWLLLPTDTYDVYFNESLTYNAYVMQNQLLDLSDVVNAPAKTGPETSESKTIASKMNQDRKDALTAYNGKYYAIPHYEAYRGVSYNVDVFADNFLYFAKNQNNGNNGFVVSKTDAKSSGPNGKSGDYDDGLPATIEEFLKLCEKMAGMGITPFVWPGESTQYCEYLVDAIAASIGGVDAAALPYSYDSNNKQVEVITGFSGGVPTKTKMVINNDNGYYVKQLAGKYYGYQVLEKIIDKIDSYAYKLSNNDTSFTQYDSQEEFIRSALKNQPIGMIIDGNYWWNEAKPAYQRSINSYGDRAKNRNFAWMPMPTAVNESDRVSGAKEPVLTDVMKSYAFVNANIAEDASKVKLAKEFVSFCYSDESLREFTTTTGVAKGLNYELLPTEEAALDSFAKSCWTMRKKATIVPTLSKNRMVIENEMALTHYMHEAVVSGDAYNTPFRGFLDGITAAEYFQGQWVSKNKWTSEYGRYFTEGV